MKLLKTIYANQRISPLSLSLSLLIFFGWNNFLAKKS